MSTLMVDCTSVNVPAVVRQFGTAVPVAGYVTGSGGIEWSEAQFALFTRKIRIAQSADLALDEASVARVLDVERFAATPADWPEWFATRTSPAQATCYCSLWSVPLVQAACRAEGIEDPPRWWLAWYPDQPGPLSLVRLLGELQTLTGVELPPSSVWAWQYAANAGGPWDLSQVFGTADFSRR